MDLVQRGSAWQRNDLVIRLGCWMVTLSMVFSLVIQPPKAKAIALVDDAAIVTSVIVAVMVYGGYRFWLNNIEAGTFSDIIKPKVKQWNYQHGSSAEDPYSGFAEWSAGGMDNFRKSITPGPGNSGPNMKGLSWLLAGALFEKVCEFVEWLGKELGVQPGVEEPVPIVPSPGGSGSVTAANVLDKALSLAHSAYSEMAKRYDYDADNFFKQYQEIVNAKYKVAVYHPGPKSDYMRFPYLILWSNERPISLSPDGFGNFVMIHGYVKPSTGRETGSYVTRTWVSADGKQYTYSSGSYSDTWGAVCDYAPGVVFTGMETASAPSATLALPDKWAPVLPAEGAESVPMVIPGAAPAETLDVDALAQEILKRLSQNELEVMPSGSPAPDPGTQPDPKPSPDPNPNLEDLDLPSLGAALTSRFPFSIPWDVVRGIKLLAAPAEAPYWEVDFLAPIAGRVGGWKGSTKVVIDMGQYEIIGQLCRWTSTIGFCLILAGGTKKLIWTA